MCPAQPKTIKREAFGESGLDIAGAHRTLAVEYEIYQREIRHAVRRLLSGGLPRRLFTEVDAGRI